MLINVPPPIKVQNSFDVLSDLPDGENDTDVDINTENDNLNNYDTSNISNRRNVLPFWLEMSPNYRDYLKQISVITNREAKFNLMNTSRVVRINIETDESYRKVQDFLELGDIKFYSLQPNAMMPLKYVLKGLPDDIPIDEIKNEIELIGVEVISTNNIGILLH